MHNNLPYNQKPQTEKLFTQMPRLNTHLHDTKTLSAQ